jgi:hypothetical protein
VHANSPDCLPVGVVHNTAPWIAGREMLLLCLMRICLTHPVPAPGISGPVLEAIPVFRQVNQGPLHQHNIMNNHNKLTDNSEQIIPAAIPPPLPRRLYDRVKANWIAIVLLLACFAIFNTYTYMRMSGDTLAAGYLPFSFIYYHTPFLEHFANPGFTADAYAFTTVNGHLMSIFPIVTPVLITPFVWVCTLGMAPGHAVIYAGAIARTASAGIAAIAPA